MKKLFCVLLACVLLAGTFLMTACDPKEKPAENDPCATVKAGETTTYPTLGEAVAYIRTLKENGYTEPVTVTLAAGDYFEEEPVLLDAVMSNLTIESDPENRARVIGGYRVDGFEPDEFNGVACLSAPVRNGDFTDFYVNGERASMTRYPHEGYLLMGDTGSDGAFRSTSSSFVAGEGDIGDFRHMDRIRLTFLHLWIDEHTPIESYDPETRLLTMKYTSTYGIAAGQEYFLENVAEAFGRPDDWYYEDGRVYYIPRDESITPDTIEAYVPTALKIFDIAGTPEEAVEGITLKGLSICVGRGEYTAYKNGEPRGSDNQSLSETDGYISFNYAKDCLVEDCGITNYGLYGLKIFNGCHGITVSRCDFRDGGAGGVFIRGAEDETSPEATDHNTVADCTIRHCGRRYAAGCGILMIDTGSNVIEHNEISDLYYSGISCGWGWCYDETPSHDNLITKNHIYDIGQGVLSDLAAIYTLGTLRNTVISYNLIHDISHADYGSRAFGLDQGTSFLTIENNICYNLGTSSVGCGSGHENLLRNNIFFAGGGQVFDDGTTETEHQLTFENNIIITDGKVIHKTSRNSLSRKLLLSTDNLIFDTTGADITVASFDKDFGLENCQKFFGLEEGSVIADPGFADPENHDFTLSEDSPALAIGFVPFDLSDVGPRR